MRAADQLVEEVVNLARVPWGKRRREIRRELCAHIEDFVAAARGAGHGDEEIEKMVGASFGDPGQIADGFAWVYRRERALARVGVFLLSSVMVASLMLSAVLTLQAGLALGFGNSVLKMLYGRHAAIEALDILFTVVTYAGLVALEELFEGKRFFKALALAGLAFAVLMGVCAAVHVRAPFLVFAAVNGAFFRAIQVFIKSGTARTGMAAVGIAAFAIVSFGVMPFRFPYALIACLSWLAMGAAYRQMPDAVARMDAALNHRLQRI